MDVLLTRIREAIELYLDAREDAEVGPLELVGVQRIAV